MCGITGIFAFTEKGKSDLLKINSATACLSSRGPDGEGVYIQNNVALGHRRLSIIDTSDLAAQPFTDATGRYSIIFNGEIFNYKELRQRLILKGYTFRSHSDTEVLLYLFIREKEKCLTKLDGEFAFAIYDSQERQLFLARDRFGVKPLYYYQDADRFIFGSEIKSLLAFDIPKAIDKSSLQMYFHLNYIPSPYSIFENVLKVEAGSYLQVKKEGSTNKIKYYNTTFENAKTLPDYEAAKMKLHSLLENSVQQRMVADVPLGTFLSGGIDSSIITAIAARNISGLHTFSIGYKDEPHFDETYYASLVAKKHNTEHTVFRLNNNDLYDQLFHLLDNLDEPFADSSALAVNILCKLTKQHVTVALSGDGADEIFAGYNKHAAELKARKGGIMFSLLKSTHPFLKQLPKSRNSPTGNLVRKLEKFVGGLKLTDRERYWNWAKWSGYKADEIFNSAFVSSLSENIYEQRKTELLKFIEKDYNSVLITDMKLVLENDMLVKVDRMSMSQSLEVRVPFLDHKLVDFAFSLPAEYKIDNKNRKKILKDAFKKDLPDELLKREKKGFEVPLLKWFRTDLKTLITEDLLSDKFIAEQNIFNPVTIRQLKTQLFSKSPNDAVEKIWALIVFQYWWKKHFKTL